MQWIKLCVCVWMALSVHAFCLFGQPIDCEQTVQSIGPSRQLNIPLPVNNISIIFWPCWCLIQIGVQPRIWHDSDLIGWARRGRRRRCHCCCCTSCPLRCQPWGCSRLRAKRKKEQKGTMRIHFFTSIDCANSASCVCAFPTNWINLRERGDNGDWCVCACHGSSLYHRRRWLTQ